MFTWRKKPDGFEWHEYIRTTILVRRRARRQKVVDARRAAGQQMQAAGVALAAGSRAAGSGLRQGALAGTGALALTLQGAWGLPRCISSSIARPIADLVVGLMSAARWGWSGPLHRPGRHRPRPHRRPRQRGRADPSRRRRADGEPAADARPRDSLAPPAPAEGGDGRGDGARSAGRRGGAVHQRRRPDHAGLARSPTCP